MSDVGRLRLESFRTRILVAITLLALVIGLADWREILRTLSEVEWEWVAGAAALSLVDRTLLTVRWQMLLAGRVQQVPFWKLFRVLLAANFLGSFLPSSLGVDAVRIAALCRAGHPASEVVATTLVDRVTLVVATLFFGSAMIMAQAGTRFPEEMKWVIFLTTASSTLLILAVFQSGVRRVLVDRVIGRMPAKWRLRTAEVGRAMLAYRYQAGRLAALAVVTLVIFAVRILFAKVLTLACGLEIDIVDLLLVVPVLWVIVMLPITVGGLGLQDLGYVAMYALVGVPAGIAVSMSLIEHVVVRLVCLPGVFFLADVTNATETTPVDVMNR